MRQFRFLAAMTTGTMAWSVALGAAAASAASRLRSGSLHAQLVSHVTPAGNTPSSLLLAGSGVIVGSLAVLALAFLFVTLIRHRVTAPSPQPAA